MIEYAVHTIESAPEDARPHLRALQQALGILPNLAASMAESPATIEGFVAVREIQSRGTFTAAEVQILSLTNACENGCDYCVALHSSVALQAGVAAETVAALRAGRSPIEPRSKTLSDLSRSLIRRRGKISAEELAAFVAAGFTPAQALEVVLGIAVSILPNFAHQLTRCGLDPVFQAQTWNAPAA